jgi:hypothetical protein
MDVQGDHSWAGPDTAATAVVPTLDRPGGTGAQGRLFADAAATFADTDQIPAVAPVRRPRPSGASWWLRIAVAVVALAVVAGAVALALAQTGVIANQGTDTTAGHTAGHTSSTRATSGTGSGSAGRHAASGAALATKVSVGPTTAVYAVHAGAYHVTVATTSGRCWVSIGGTGHAPTFAGILPASSSQSAPIYGPSTVQLGAGGTSVTLSAPGHRSVTLTPLAAPFTYQFTAAQ